MWIIWAACASTYLVTSVMQPPSLFAQSQSHSMMDVGSTDYAGIAS